MPGEILYCVSQVQVGTEIELIMLSSINRGYFPEIASLIATRVVERNRKRLQRPATRLGRVMKYGRRIKSATEPYSQRNIGNQFFSNGVFEETVEFFLCAPRIYLASLCNMELP